MKRFVRLKPSRLTDRLDAVYYHPSFLENEDRLNSSSIKILRLKTLVKEGRRSIYFRTQTMQIGEAPNDWVPFLTADDLGEDGFFVNLDARRRVSPSFADKYPKGQLRGNELLVKVKGPNQTTAYNEMTPENRVLVSGTIWGGLVKKDRVDPHYLVSALSCPYAAIARSRLRTNLNVEFLAPDDLLNLELPIPETRVTQTYIGNKVRLAERLRNRAQELEARVNNIFESVGLFIDTSFKRCNCVPPELLNNRLDYLHYRSDLLANFKKISQFSTALLGDTRHFINLSDGDHGNPAYGQGPIYIRVSEIKGNRLDETIAFRLDEAYAATISSSCWAKPGDVVFSIVGTLGAVAVIRPESKGIMSRGIAKVTPISLPVYYVKAYMRSLAFSKELLRYSVGTIQRGVYLESLLDIGLPILEKSLIDLIALMEESADDSIIFSQQLTTAAKLLVEALIEGKITEDELKTAQEALQRGDRELDQLILSRLTRKGFDVKGEPPLFPDLDTLYEAIDQLDADSEEES
jgi:type I restriction enzyme S subunit